MDFFRVSRPILSINTAEHWFYVYHARVAAFKLAVDVMVGNTLSPPETTYSLFNNAIVR